MEAITPEKLLELYRDKILGVRNYKSSKDEFFADDLSNLDSLEPFLDEVCTSESDITPAGKKFLADYYGFEKLASQLIERANLKEFYDETFTYEYIKGWLHELTPMQAITFIEGARGNIEEGATLNSKLLPPEY